jgi:hypothetical protein
VDGGAATLGAVAGLMQAHSAESDPLFRALAGAVDASVDLLGGLFFPVAATKLQAEQVMVFVGELLEADDGLRATQEDLGALAQCLADGVDALGATLGALDGHARALSQHVTRLKRALEGLRLLEITGRIEATGLRDTEAVLTLFKTIAERISTASRELDDLSDAGRFPFARDAAAARRSRQHVDAMRQHVLALGCA